MLLRTIHGQDLPVGKSAPLATAVSTPARNLSRVGGQSHSIAFPSTPAHLGVPSLSETPAVMPKGGIKEASTPPEEEDEEEEPPDEGAGAGAAGAAGLESVAAAAGAEEAIVMKVLGVPPPNWPPGPPPKLPPPKCPRC